jgi:Ca-activated chloride channel family protein
MQRKLPEAGMRATLILLFFIVPVICGNALFSQCRSITNVLIVFDCSNSMSSKWGSGTRMDAAKSLLNQLVDSLHQDPDVHIALRVYGSQSSVETHDCKDTKLEVPFSRTNIDRIKNFAAGAKPTGYTPIAYSLTQAAADFSSACVKNVIILITDGIEECEGDPCTVSKQLQARNIVFKPYIIGIGLSDEKMQFFDCVGRYYSPKNAAEIKTVVSSVVSQATGSTSLQVLLNDGKGQPKYTDVDMTFTNSKTNKIEYNLFHTMNEWSKPDTFAVDPLPTYTLQINTTPPIIRQGIGLTLSQNNILKIDAPQGVLQMVCENKQEYKTLPVLVRKASKQDIVYVQEMHSSHQYLTGNYDVEILTLPRIKINNVQIKEGAPNRLAIPAPGKVDLSYGKLVIGSIYVYRNNALEWLTDIDAAGVQRKEQFLLQPGRYVVIYRATKSNEIMDTHERWFTIVSGSTESIKLD